MSANDCQFMLWVREPQGDWVLRRTSRQRATIESEAGRLPSTSPWRMVSLWDGVLAESLARA